MLRLIDEADKEEVFGLYRLNGDFHARRFAIAIDLGAGFRSRFAGFSRALKRCAELWPKALPRHEKNIAIVFAGGDLQKAVNVPRVIQGFIFLIDQNRSRRENFNEDLRGQIRTGWGDGLFFSTRRRLQVLRARQPRRQAGSLLRPRGSR